MPIVCTFDLTNFSPNDHNRIRAGFERLGWENLGGTAYRYPRLGTDHQPVEDWLNHVVPALMLFRAYLRTHPTVELTKFTLDAHSSSGYNPSSGFGTAAVSGPEAASYQPTHAAHFGRRNLEEWLDGIQHPYTDASDPPD